MAIQRILLKSKIQRASVTEADLHYEGSITIDATLMEKAAIVEYEQVHVYNISNGHRFVTYAISGPPGAGQITVNGAAARLASPGDLIIIASYADYSEEDLERHEPVILLVDSSNEVVSVKSSVVQEV